MLSLPAVLKKDDFEVVSESGTDFAKLQNFCIETIIDACASSTMIINEAEDKISSALDDKTEKKVHLVIMESKRTNTWAVYPSSSLCLSVKKVDFYFFTTSD